MAIGIPTPYSALNALRVASVDSTGAAQETTRRVAAQIWQNPSLAIAAQSNALSEELVDFLLHSAVD